MSDYEKDINASGDTSRAVVLGENCYDSIETPSSPRLSTTVQCVFS